MPLPEAHAKAKVLLVTRSLSAAGDLGETVASLGYEVLGPVLDWSWAVELAAEHHVAILLVELGFAQESASRSPFQKILKENGPSLVCFCPRGYSGGQGFSQRGANVPLSGAELPLAAPAETFLLLPSPRSDIQAALATALARNAPRDLLFHQKLAVITTDLLGRVTFLNAAASRITGWSMQQATGHPMKEVAPLSDSPPPLEAVLESRIRAKEGTEVRPTITLTRRDRSTCQVYDLRSPLRDQTGGLTGMVVLLEEIFAPDKPAAIETRGEEIPRNLHPGKSLPGSASMLQSIADPLFSVEEDWTVGYVNEAARDVFAGISEDPGLQNFSKNATGSVLWELLPKAVYPLLLQEFTAAQIRRQPRIFEFHLTSPKSRWFECQLYPNGSSLLCLMRETTGRREAEEQERKMEKLESLGLLARGFAHDFNNVLTVLLGNLSVAEHVLPKGTAGREEVVTARRASMQAQGLVQHLLTFARGGAPLKQPADLARLLRDWSLEWPHQTGLDYHFEISPLACLVEVDRQQIQRLIHNLVRNAEQALGKRGTLRIRLAPAGHIRRLPAPMPIGPSELEHWIILQVIDDGEGIPEENLAKVFEPYFTTREDANASGLGLTVCESIIKAHGAILSLQSRLGQGTVATLAFPRYTGNTPEGLWPLPSSEALAGSDHAEPQENDSHSKPAPPPQSRKRRILVLEDELLIRRLISSQLHSMNCEVVETEDGVRTLQLYEQAKLAEIPFDLVIMDLSIPGGLGGTQTMEMLRQLDPGVKAIVSSGYSDDPVMQQSREHGFQARLPKPYRMEELRELVEAVLSAAAPEPGTGGGSNQSDQVS